MQPVSPHYPFFSPLTLFRLPSVGSKIHNLMLGMKKAMNGDFSLDQKKNLKKLEVSNFERMKTVFGHANMEEGACASIFNVLFDKTGELIISGADDA